MENNIINNGGGLKLENPVEVTLPYTATRDCFIGFRAITQGEWYMYFTRNNTDKNLYRFAGNQSTGMSIGFWFPLKKGDTISKNITNVSDYTLYVM